MKKILLKNTLLLLWLFSFSSLAATSTMTKNYYFNDFVGEIINDANTTLSGLNISNAVQEESALSIDATGGKLYSSVLVFTFSSALDLSDNAMITIEGQYQDLELSSSLPDGVELMPRMLIKLIDENNNATAGGSNVYNFGLAMKKDVWTTANLNLKTYPGSVDFSKIKKLVVTFQAQSSFPSGTSFTSGKFLFNKVELGELSEEAKVETSILTQYSFLNNFMGPTVSDINQATIGSTNKVAFTQESGRLDIYTETGLNAWQTYFRTTLTAPVNMSKTYNRKGVIKFEIKDLVDAGSETVHLRMRIYDEYGTKKIVELSGLEEGIHERFLDFGENTYTEPLGNTFDYTKVDRFEICSYNKATSSGHIYLDYLLLGADIIPIDITFDSFTAEDGLTIAVNPPAPLMQEAAFNFKNTETGEVVTGITRNMLEDGAKFNFHNGLDTANSYELSLTDTLYYLGNSLVFSDEGMILNIGCELLSATTESIIIEFDRVVNLDIENFILKDTSNIEVTIDSIKTRYSGQEYQLFVNLAEATNYILEISSDSYLFGEPMEIRVAINPVNPVIDWNNIVGKLTPDHWGVNDGSAGTSTINTKMAQFYSQVKPGVLRLHHKGYVEKWVDVANKTWNKDKIKSDLDNAKDTYKHAERIILTLDAPPSFISSTFAVPLTETEEDELAEFFAQLPGIIKELGHHIDMYEFLNEKEGRYENNYPAYWRMLNKIAIAMKTADPTVKCGGPAVSWPTASIYKGFIDNCSQNMDFVSFHLYARGPGAFDDDDLFTGGHAYRTQANSAGAVANYLKEKGITHLETFLDEFNVQYVWEPYEPAHHNYIGASWMACFIKHVALKGVTGLNVWNTEDGAYGLNYNSAPANLYLMSRKYLRGDVVESSEPADKIEMIPVISQNGEKSILFINRTGQQTTVVNAKALIGGDESEIKGMRLDHTTNVGGKVYITQTMSEVPADILLNPYGMVLLTNVTADVVSAPTNLTAAYILENEVGLTWSSDALTRKGFRVYCNGESVADIQEVVDTVFVLRGLKPNTTYNIKISTIDEYGDIYPTGETSISVTTRKMPLKINDRTTGTDLHRFNYDKNWNAVVSDAKIMDAVVYNKDITTAKSPSSIATVRYKGNTIALYGLRKAKTDSIKIFVDDILKKVITKENALDFGGLVYYESDQIDEEHIIRIEADADFSLDRLDIYGNLFENVTEKPAKVADVETLSTTNLIYMTWSAPAHSSEIQYYRILTTKTDEIGVDTVYSPEFTILGLQENTTYPVTIEAYDPCGNMSTSDEMNFSTIFKESVEIAQATGTVAIDGVADEEAWNASPQLEIANSTNEILDKSDISAWFKIIWAQRYLYIYIDVADNVKVSRTDIESELNEHDGFGLYLDGNNRKSGPYDLKDACIKALYNPIQYEEHNNVNTMIYAVSETEKGYGIELRYNLTDLGMAPGAVGKELGLDIHINDNDKEGTYGLDNKLTWQKNSGNAALNKALLGNMIFVETLTGISNPELDNKLLKIYPNPVAEQLNLLISDDNFRVAIYDNMGSLICTYENQRQINISDLTSGLYIVQVTLPEGSLGMKFIKK